MVPTGNFLFWQEILNFKWFRASIAVLQLKKGCKLSYTLEPQRQGGKEAC